MQRRKLLVARRREPALVSGEHAPDDVTAAGDGGRGGGRPRTRGGSGRRGRGWRRPRREADGVDVEVAAVHDLEAEHPVVSPAERDAGERRVRYVCHPPVAFTAIVPRTTPSSTTRDRRPPRRPRRRAR